MKETPKTVAQFLASLANDLRSGRDIELVLDDLENALDEWREIWPDNTKGISDEDDKYDDDEEEEDDEDEIL